MFLINFYKIQNNNKKTKLSTISG